MNNSNNTSVAILCRFPTPGKTKTRMIPRIGPKQAATLQIQLLKHLINNLAQPTNKILSNYQCSLWLTGESLKNCEEWVTKQHFPQINHSPIALHMQPSGDLGQRMSAICKDLLNTGRQQVILIGSDIPNISAHTIANAIDALNTHNVVIGPAQDGGYYLIGMTNTTYEKHKTTIFSNIPWGTKNVFRNTTERLAKLHIYPAILEQLRDIDRPEDLDYAQALLGNMAFTSLDMS